MKVVTYFLQIILIFTLSCLSYGSTIPQYVNKMTTVHALGLGENVTTTDNVSGKPTYAEYLKQRKEFIMKEQRKSIGADVDLNGRELIANDILMAAKNEELMVGFKDPYKFIPSRQFFEVQKELNSSKLFSIIKHMPKGGVLHAHDTALCSIEFLISLTYRPHLWECHNPTTKSITFQFSRIPPASVSGCQWNLVSKARRQRGSNAYDEELRKRFTLYTDDPEKDFKDINMVWKKFVGIFVTVEPILTYRPVWRDYFMQALKEFHADNVQYLEFRAVLPQLYDLDGNIYSEKDVVQIYYDTVNDFKKEHPDFIGSKIIYGPVRKVNDSTFSHYMKTVVELQKQFPDFVAGFDLVSQEDLGRPLIDFAEGLLALPDDINFFFHAGETNWFGTSTDENLIDAVLLGTKRIGHGYAILKHPSVLDVVKERGIAIEVNPISNQVLKLSNDNRNHPCTFLFANNYPVVISSDDPSFWEASPLSHDFYIAFLGIASAHSDLRTLKQLVINSIAYSSLNSAEKEVAFSKWQTKWDEYIEWVIAGDNSSAVLNVIK